MESEHEYEQDYDFSAEFFTEQSLDEEKLKRIDLNKELKSKMYEEKKKELRIKSINKRKENKKNKKKEINELVGQMTKEEKQKIYNDKDDLLK